MVIFPDVRDIQPQAPGRTSRCRSRTTQHAPGCSWSTTRRRRPPLWRSWPLPWEQEICWCCGRSPRVASCRSVAPVVVPAGQGPSSWPWPMSRTCGPPSISDGPCAGRARQRAASSGPTTQPTPPWSPSTTTSPCCSGHRNRSRPTTTSGPRRPPRSAWSVRSPPPSGWLTSWRCCRPCAPSCSASPATSQRPLSTS